MKINEAIEKAIEGGFLEGQSPCIEAGTNIGCVNGDFLCKADIMLSPDFWRSLGKTEGWREAARAANGELYQMDEWPRRWHRLVDHLADGGTIESYFATL